MSYSAYTQTQNRTVAAPRDVEYRLLGTVTAALLDSSTQVEDVKKRVESVCWNRDVWSTFRRDLMHQQNSLPQTLRDELVKLSRWVDRETFQILSGDDKDLTALIDVNKNIMNGLKAHIEGEV